MQVQIENYRGWEIVFDTETESFYCHSEKYDRDSTKKSYSATKKFIDDFIKENDKFNPFWVESSPNRSNIPGKRILIVGVRKDGRFIYDNDGKKEQVSEFSEKDYILVDEANKVFWDELNDLNAQSEEIYKKRKEVWAKFKCVTLQEYKKQITNQ